MVSFGLGVLLAGSMGAPAEEGVAVPSELDIPVAAERPWFPPADQYDNGGEPLLDEDFEALMAALDAAMTAEETLADFDREADFHLWSFTRRLAVPEVGEEQQERINSYLDALAEEHPDSRDMIERSRSMLDYYATALPEMPSFVSRALSAPGLMVYPSAGEMFTDAQLDRVIAALDAVFALPESAADFESGVEVSMSSIGRGLQRGRMSDEQTARVAEELVALKETYPAAAEALDRVRFHIEYLMPGRVAPNIVGTDTEGVEFELEEYRGKIVAVIFSGQWCGPCRGEYPYQRAMLDHLFRGRGRRAAGRQQRRGAGDDRRGQEGGTSRLPDLVGRTQPAGRRRGGRRGADRDRVGRVRVAHDLRARRGGRDPAREQARGCADRDDRRPGDGEEDA